MIAIVDYGLGNIRAFENIYRRLGIDAQPVQTAEALSQADKIILPGVGAFDWAMERLMASEMIETLNSKVLEQKIPVLGICVGMQIMARSSDEGTRSGLGWFNADVRRFDEACFSQQTRLPHMGWNDVEADPRCLLFRDLEEPQYYFLHSYYLEPDTQDDIVGHTTYGNRFACAVAAGNVYGTQFHPEKSHDWGVKLLKNFAEVC
jgi:imidazole glycerol-phosphate synthase subunit HisH